MNKIKTVFHVALVLSALMIFPSFGNVQRTSCGEMFTIEIKDKPVDFSNELFTITTNSLERTINKANDKIDRKDDFFDPDMAGKIISRLNGISLLRLSDDKVDCAILVDNAKHRLLIIDSKNMIKDEFKICGPAVKRKKGFPWFKVIWKCWSLWKYECSKIDVFGEYGTTDGTFCDPVNISTCEGKEGSDPFDIWIPDSRNNRIVHLRYSRDGNMQWINSIGGFYQPLDVVYRYDEETPTLYIVEELGQVVRIPFSDEDDIYYQNMQGQVQEGGFENVY